MSTTFRSRYLITADNRQAKQAFQEIDAIQKKSFSGRGGSGVADVFGGNLASQAVSNLTAKLYEGGQAIFNYSQEVAGAKLAFESLMGSATAAAKHVKDLEALSRSTPLKFESIAGMSQRLQGAGVEAGRVIEMIKDIGNVAAATGKLTEERMDGIGLALSQVFTKGKVSAEEMNQLAERGVPAWRILSQQLGKTTGELQKMAEKGEITADVMITAFQNFSKQNYGNAMEKQAAVFGSAWQNILNVILQSSSKMFKPATDAMAKFAADTAKSLKDQEKQFGQAGVMLGYALGEAIGKGIREWRRSPDGQDIALLFQNPQMFFAKQLAGAIVGFQKGNAGPQLLPPSIDYTSPRSPGQQRRPGATPGGTPASANIKAIQQQAEQQRRLAEQMAERDLAAAIRIEEMNFSTIREQFGQQFDEILDVFGESGNISDLFTGMTTAMERYKDSISASIRFLEELENRGRSAMTEHEQALLTAQQMERRQEVVREGQQLAKKNNAILLEQHVKMGELVIARYEKEKEIADEVERQAAAFREIRQSMLMMPGMDASGEPNVFAPETQPGFTDGLFGQDGLNIIRSEAMQIGQIYQDLGSMVGDTIGQMVQGVGSLVEAWVLYGDLGPNAVRKMTASILAGLAAQAAVKAIFQLAEGFAALFFNPAEAAAHFKAAALYGAVAIGAGLAGRAIAGDSFKEGGRKGSSSASAGASRSSSASLTPISRQSETTFMSGRNPWQQANDRMAEVLERLEQKIKVMRPGDVIAAGATQNPEAIGNGFVTAVKRNASIGTSAKKMMG
jgi:tape measure domain-containing protein